MAGGQAYDSGQADVEQVKAVLRDADRLADKVGNGLNNAVAGVRDDAHIEGHRRTYPGQDDTGNEHQKLRQKAIRLRQQRREQVHKPCKRKAQRQLQNVLSQREQQGALRSADKVQHDFNRDKDGVESKGRVAEVEAVYNGNAV